ncbi:MAG: hypothetical protein AAGA18_04375 [Verrucomicrobiota bacterium]
MDWSEILAANSDFDRSKPVKVIRTGDASSKKMVPVGQHKKKPRFRSSSNTENVCDPKVEIVQREDGECDLLFTCSCGEQTVIRCYTLPQEANPAPKPPAAS